MSLNRIADRRSGSVRLDEADLRRVDSSVPAGLADQTRLSLGTGQGNSVGVAILIDGRSDDDGVDGITILRWPGRAVSG